MTLACGMRGAGPAMRIFGTQRRNTGSHLARTATLAVAGSLALSTALAAGATEVVPEVRSSSDSSATGWVICLGIIVVGARFLLAPRRRPRRR